MFINAASFITIRTIYNYLQGVSVAIAMNDPKDTVIPTVTRLMWDVCFVLSCPCSCNMLVV